MAKTRKSFFGRIANMLGNSEIDSDTWDDIEAILIQADVGVETTGKIIKELKSRGITKNDVLQTQLRDVMASLLKTPPTLNISGRELSIMLVVGVNGSGKTTSIGKLAHRLHTINQRKVMLAAGDTFRAAAIDQLKMWGERVGVPVVSSKPGADPAALVFDATAAAKARGYDVLIIDTAGRLHTNFNLMEELAKIRAVSDKVVPGAPHE
ncbi:MAG: signal recognition particle-docking protein FtsY, partial [Anaerolineae bacterium]|nr:signal recognition particle-docking protein FtsY [Anaerolineae bacterium]